MTSALASHTPAPQHRTLTLAVLVAVVAHILLLQGLPHWTQSTRAGEHGSAFITRMVPLAQPNAVEPSPVTAEKDPLPAPRPSKSPMMAHAQPKPKIKPIKQARPQPTNQPTTPPSAQPKQLTAEVGSTQSAAAGSSQVASSLLGPNTSGSFGGGLLPQPISPPLAEAEIPSAMAFAATAGDAPVHVAPASVLQYQTKIRTKGKIVNLLTKLNWREDGTFYAIDWKLYSETLGERSRSSIGLLSAQGLVPVLAEFRTDRVQQARFNYATRRVVFGAPVTQERASDTKSTPADIDMSSPIAGTETGTEPPPSIEARLRTGVQDRLSVLLQLGALLAGDPKRYPEGALINLPAAHADGPGIWRFEVIGYETVSALRGKQIPSVHVRHQPISKTDVRVDLWLGSNLAFLPVQLYWTEANGDTVEHVLQSAYTQQVPRAELNVQPTE